MLALILMCGSDTSSWYAELALRRRVKKSAIGSVMVMTAGSPSSRRFPFGAYRNLFGSCALAALRASAHRCYQLDFCTPGSSPACVISRRQIRQRPNLRYTACGRAHLLHRVYARTLNLGFLLALLTSAFFAICSVLLERKA